MKVREHPPRTTDLGPWYNRINPLWWLINADRKFDPAFTFLGKLIDERHPDWLRTFLFALRNPGHNFTHYVIGVAHLRFFSVGKNPGHVWAEEPGWNWTIHVVNWWRVLPFFSHRGKKFEFYFGWRNDGNFGIAFRQAH